MKTVLVAGSNADLEKYIYSELQKKDYIVRTVHDFSGNLAESLNGIDYVISVIDLCHPEDEGGCPVVNGIANNALLEEAMRQRVKKFIYVTGNYADKLRNLRATVAKELFVENLITSGISYGIVRPTCIYTNISKFLQLADAGMVLLLGMGKFRINPIHEEDLAEVCVRSLNMSNPEILVGGSEVLTYREIARMAFAARGQPEKVIAMPVWLARIVVSMIKVLSPGRHYGAFECLLRMPIADLIGPSYGNRSLYKYFCQQVQDQKEALLSF